MYKFNNRNMLLALCAIAENDEKILYPLYGGLGGHSAFNTSALHNTYGYTAVTDRNRLVFIRFNAFGMPVDNGSYYLENLVSLKVSKFLKLHTIKASFDVNGKKKKFWFQANEVVHGTDFYCQKINLPLFISALKKFSL